MCKSIIHGQPFESKASSDACPSLLNRTGNDNQVCFSTRDFSCCCVRLTIWAMLCSVSLLHMFHVRFLQPSGLNTWAVSDRPVPKPKTSHNSPEKHTVALKTARKTMEKTCSRKHGPRRHIFTVSNPLKKKINGTATGIAVLVSFSRTTAFQSPLLPGPQTSTRDILVRLCVPSGAKTSQYFAHETILYIGARTSPPI